MTVARSDDVKAVDDQTEDDRGASLTSIAEEQIQQTTTVPLQNSGELSQ